MPRRHQQADSGASERTGRAGDENLHDGRLDTGVCSERPVSQDALGFLDVAALIADEVL